jgi:hypothetical protein
MQAPQKSVAHILHRNRFVALWHMADLERRRPSLSSSINGAVLSSSGTPVSATPGGRTPITFSNTTLQPGHFTNAAFSLKKASFAASSHILRARKNVGHEKPLQVKHENLKTIGTW